MKSSLTVREYLLPVHLGCGAEERRIPQDTLISLRIEFESLPEACRTDRLEDTVCYDVLCKTMKASTFGKEFQTVEHLGSHLHMTLIEKLPRGSHLQLIVHKLHPPVEGLSGGVVFELS